MLMVQQAQMSNTQDKLFQNFLGNYNQGFYAKGFSYLEVVLEPMEYTVVACAKQQQSKGSFRIDIRKVKITGEEEYQRDFDIEDIGLKECP